MTASSRRGRGLVGAWRVEAILRDERLFTPVRTVHDGHRGFHGVTFGMSRVLAADGVEH